MADQPTQHTPKLWRKTPGGKKHPTARFIMRGDVFIAKVYGHQRQAVDLHADLIAAAPDLRDALADLIHQVKGVVGAEDLDSICFDQSESAIKSTQA